MKKLIFVDGVVLHCRPAWLADPSLHQTFGIITKNVAGELDTQWRIDFLTVGRLCGAPRRGHRSTQVTPGIVHPERKARTSCFITRHDADFFQLQRTGHKTRLTTSSTGRSEREKGVVRVSFLWEKKS